MYGGIYDFAESTFTPCLTALTFVHHVKSCKVLGGKTLLRALLRCLTPQTPLPLFLFSPHTLLFWKDVRIIYIEWIYNLWSLAERNRMLVFSAWQSALVQQPCCWTSLQAAFNGFSDNNRRLRRGSEMWWDKSQSAYRVFLTFDSLFH